MDLDYLKYFSEDGIELHHMDEVFLVLCDWKNKTYYVKEAKFDKDFKVAMVKHCREMAKQGWSSDYLGLPCWWEQDGKYDKGRVGDNQIFVSMEAANFTVDKLNNKDK